MRQQICPYCKSQRNSAGLLLHDVECPYNKPDKDNEVKETRKFLAE